MSESGGDGAIVGEIPTAHRVAELEIEVARLDAELNEARGGDAVSGASRFLSIAAATIDQAVSEVTQEAETAVAKLRIDIEQSQVEARQAVAAARVEAEATRAAAAQATVDARMELEKARTSAMTVSEEAAAAAEETKRHAKAEAEQTLATANDDAKMAMVSERQRFTREVDALTDVREALVKERHALEQYHLQVQARVRELAQAMVSFMTNTSGHTTNTSDHESLEALANLTMPISEPPEALPVPSVTEEVWSDVVSARPPFEPVTFDEAMEPVAAPTSQADPEPADHRPEDLFSDSFGLDASGRLPSTELESPIPQHPVAPRPVVEAVPPEPEPVSASNEVQEDPWREVDPSEGPPHPIFGTPIAAPVPSTVGGDLFAPAHPDEGSSAEKDGAFVPNETDEGETFVPDNTDVGESVELDETDDGETSAMDEPAAGGALAVVEPASARTFAIAENDDMASSEVDAQFQSFIDGDEDDASRSWLLRSEES
jgi:hypothetical protein